MAQWGAYGFAQKGASYEDILAHYYRNTTLGPAPLSKVRVFLAQGRSRLSLGSNAAFTVRDGSDQTWHIAAGTLTFGPGLKIKTTDVQQPQQLTGPLTFIPGTSPLRFGSTAYRGQLQVSVANGRLRAINLVGLEALPLWRRPVRDAEGLAARGAQGAGRRCALVRARRSEDRLLVRSLPGHAEPGLSRDRARGAHDDRRGQRNRGRGRSLPWRSGHDVFLLELGRPHRSRRRRSSRARPRCRISSRSAIPTTRSRRTIAGARSSSRRPASSELSACAGALSDVTLQLGPSGRVETITGVGAQGAASMKGWDFRRAFGLDSTWFRIGVLSLGSPQGPVTYGTRVSIDGVARSLPSVRLDRRQSGAGWQTVGPVTPGAGGSVVIKTKPKMPTDYRLVSGQVRSRVAHVSVAPLVRFRGLGERRDAPRLCAPALPRARAWRSSAAPEEDGRRSRVRRSTRVETSRLTST